MVEGSRREVEGGTNVERREKAGEEDQWPHGSLRPRRPANALTRLLLVTPCARCSPLSLSPRSAGGDSEPKLKTACVSTREKAEGAGTIVSSVVGCGAGSSRVDLHQKGLQRSRGERRRRSSFESPIAGLGAAAHGSPSREARLSSAITLFQSLIASRVGDVPAFESWPKSRSCTATAALDVPVATAPSRRSSAAKVGTTAVRQSGCGVEAELAVPFRTVFRGDDSELRSFLYAARAQNRLQVNNSAVGLPCRALASRRGGESERRRL